jgi:hypothetical protein
VAAGNNNVYAGKDGNVYKRDSGGSWQKYEDGNWNHVDTSAAKEQASQRAQSVRDQRSTNTSGAAQQYAGQARERALVQPETFQGLNHDAQARQRGTQQTQRFQNYQRQGGGGFGGRSMAGRRR